MSKAPEFRYWRKLKRHPLSEAYPDLSGALAENMREGVKKFGIVNGRKVTVHEDPDDNDELKVLDGWQMYTACVEENRKPQFQRVPKGMTAEEFVQVVNDHRRHESPEAAIARIVKRRERVVAARVEGKSLRTIAEEEGVSNPTILKDLEAAEATGIPVIPVGGKVKSRDGRERPAEREPGDDSAQERAEKEAPKNGAAMWEPAKFDQAYGVILREIDALGKCFKAKESPEAHGLRRLLKEYRSQFAKWHQQLKKAHRGT